MTIRTSILLAASAWAMPFPAVAQIAVSANDGKQLRPGEAPATRVPDSVSIIDLGQTPPRTVGMVLAPTSMIGPPTSVAVAPDESFALVTAAQQLEGGNIVKGDVISVIDLSRPASPRVIQTLNVASGASGVAINDAGTLAMVAGTGDDSISVFSISGKKLSLIKKVRLDYQSRPTDVTFSPDGKSAYAVAQTTGAIVRLSIAGQQVERVGTPITPGVSPYGVTIGRDGRFAFNTNLGGAVRPSNAPRGDSGATIGTVSVIDLQSGALANSVEVGMTPEHVALSPDGKYLAVVVANGSAAPVSSPTYHDHGLMKIFAVDGSTLTPAGEARTGAWCQGAAWSKDNRRILLQCALTREIEVYNYDGTTLVRDSRATLKFAARPGAISTAADR